MTWLSRLLLILVALAIGYPEPADATPPGARRRVIKSLEYVPPPPPTSPVSPSTKQVPLPNFNNNTKTDDSQPKFPVLPVSRPCNKYELEGLWKLIQVYEVPSGMQMASFLMSPVQYLLFRGDGLYGKLNAGTIEMDPTVAAQQIVNHASGLQQYLVQSTGMMYFYQDGVAIDSQVCFIVVTPKDTFIKGQMLLMPPEGQIQGRVVKVYTKIWGVRNPAPAANPRALPTRR